MSSHNPDTAPRPGRAAFLARAQTGSPNQGACAFGWADNKVDLHPTEGPLLRAAVKDATDCVPLREIVRRWTADGVTTVRGGQ